LASQSGSRKTWRAEGLAKAEERKDRKNEAAAPKLFLFK